MKRFCFRNDTCTLAIGISHSQGTPPFQGADQHPTKDGGKRTEIYHGHPYGKSPDRAHSVTPQSACVSYPSIRTHTHCKTDPPTRAGDRCMHSNILNLAGSSTQRFLNVFTDRPPPTLHVTEHRRADSALRRRTQERGERSGTAGAAAELLP